LYFIRYYDNKMHV